MNVDDLNILEFSPLHEVVSIYRRMKHGATLTKCSYPRSQEDEEKSKNVWLKGHKGMLSPRYGATSVIDQWRQTLGPSLFSGASPLLRCRSCPRTENGAGSNTSTTLWFVFSVLHSRQPMLD